MNSNQNCYSFTDRINLEKMPKNFTFFNKTDSDVVKKTSYAVVKKELKSTEVSSNVQFSSESTL